MLRFLLLLVWKKKVKRFNKIKSSYHANCLELYICRWICCQHNPNETLSLYLQHASCFDIIMHVLQVHLCFMSPTFSIPLSPMHTQNGHCTLALSPSQGIQSLYNGKQMSLTAVFFHSTLQKHYWGGTCTKLVIIQKSPSAHSWALCIYVNKKHRI
jgi:hypothetical protein